MNSIGLAVALLCGSALGLLILGRYPAGIDPAYGLGLLGLAAAAALSAIIGRRDRRALWCSLLAAFALAGCGRALLVHPPVTQDDLAFYNGTPTEPTVTVAGVVSSEPLFSDKSQTLRVSARSISSRQDPAGHAVSGDMYAIVPRYPEHMIGETVTLTGKLTAPISDPGFDYAAYLAHLGVFSYMAFPKVSVLAKPEQNGLAGEIVAQRIAARHTLESVVPEPEASVAVGVVTGDRTSMPDALKTAFKSSGTAHILAISGENLALLVGLLWIFRRNAPVKRRLRTWWALAVILLIVLYTLFTGATPSVDRAAIMAVVLLLGPLVGRRYDPVAALAVSAAIMVTADPNMLSDAGFLLSFGAMVGIFTLAPSIQAFLRRARIPVLVAAPLSVSLGAVVTNMPLSALLIGQVSLVSPLATLTADFALAPLMLSGILTILVGNLGTWAAAIPGLLVWIPSWWLVANAQLWASVPGAGIDASGVTFIHVLLYYGALSAMFVIFSNPERRARVARLTPSFTTALLGVAVVAIWATALVMALG